MRYTSETGRWAETGCCGIFHRTKQTGSEKRCRGPVALVNIITYLKVSRHNTSTYRQCDEDLYDALRKMVGESLVNGKELKIDPGRARFLLPVDERYYDVPLTSGKRKDWLADALTVTSEADLVFINPDNGIANLDNGIAFAKDAKSPKHASIAELRRFAEQGKSLAIYHTWKRKEGITADEQIRRDSKALQVALKLSSPPWALRWHRISGRAYLIVPQPEQHRAIIRERLDAFLDKKKSRWAKRGHFTEVKVPP